MNAIVDNTRTGRATHDIAFTSAEGLTCNCGEVFADPEAWHLHTVHTFNNPSPSAIEARGKRVLSVVSVPPAPERHSITECTKVACHAQGNGRECVRLTITSAAGVERTLFELDRATAERIAAEGALVSSTYLYSFC